MSWRKHSSHAEETAAVKAALRKAGIPFRSVGHGTGTAWSWLEIYIGANRSGLTHVKGEPDWLCRPECPACKGNRAIHDKAIAVAQQVTGRDGDYDGRILALQQ